MQTDSGTSLFKKSSKTYFYSSLFFPKDIRQQVTTLYSFVRTADNYVDVTPQQLSELNVFIKNFNDIWKGKGKFHPIISPFVSLAKERSFKKEWIDSFLQTMKQDTLKKEYKTLDETLHYMFGSAEVVGLMMCQILNIPKETHKGAQYLGRSMQYINFIRDIVEDTKLSRQYLPTEELKQFKLNSLRETDVIKNTTAFNQFIQFQIHRYREWQDIAETSYKYIPYRYAVPIKTASSMYKYTADVIYNTPMIVYKKKVKPSASRIISTGLFHMIGGLR